MRTSILLLSLLLVGGSLAAQSMPMAEVERAGPILRPGDALRVTVLRHPELSGEFSVTADGTLLHPLYRELHVVGVPMSEVDAMVRAVLTRDDLATSCATLVDRAMAPVREALRNAGNVDPDEIDDVVIVGGSSRLAVIRQRLSEAFHGRDIHHTVNPDTAIAVGAARSYAC